MLTYNLSGKNKYWSLYAHIREDILSGKLKCGERLPSKRSLAENLDVSVITVQNAYEQLLAEGYICAYERNGYFVADVKETFYGGKFEDIIPPETRKTYAVDFVKGSVPSSLFPFSVWTKILRRELSDCGEHLLERVPCDGDMELKRAISAYLYRARGIDVSARYVVIGAGAEYLYGVIVQLLGRDKLYALENPGYGKIASSYTLNGASYTYVNVIEGGICLNEVEKSGADVLHISPSHQFPTGEVTPATSRTKLISWAKAGGRYIIEDDYDSEFRLSGKPLQCMHSLAPDRVIYMNTFSKTLAPSLRMGYMVLPPALYERYTELFSHSANVVPLFEQKTLAGMIDGGHFERHINRLKNHYKIIRQAILDKAKSLPFKCELKDTGSGLHLLAYIPDAESDKQIKEVALSHGINIRCLSDYLVAPLKGVEKMAVVNYSGVTKEQIEGIKL
jgi:GntR family transcriptional regulator/MocR family aminotransferase